MAAPVTVMLDDAQAQALFARLVDLVSRPAGPLRQSAQALRRLVYDTFQDQSDPWGRRWQAWAPATRQDRTRRQSSGAILRDTGALYRSINATADDGGVSVDATSEYASYHQFGNPGHRAWGGKPSPLAQRAFLPVRAPGVADVPASWWPEILFPVETALARVAQ